MQIQHFFDELTATLTYLVHDGRRGIVIDPIRDYEPKSAHTSWAGSERVAAAIDRARVQIDYVIDTHAHADHMTGLPFFRERYGARAVTGAGIGQIQRAFRELYGLGADFAVDGRQFDVLLGDGERLHFGALEVEALSTPGHTPAHVSLRIGDAVFLGDTLFTSDYGAARCDFPGGSPDALYESIQRLYDLPGATRLFVCHDYRPGGRPLAPESNVDEHRRANIQIDAKTSRADFVAFRRARDAQLEAPLLILPAMQVNIRAGELPATESNGTAYLKIPLDRLGAGK